MTPNSTPAPTKTAWFRDWVVPALLIVHVTLLAWLSVKHSPTTDEIGHLPSGLSYYEFGTFSLYKVNPPLIKAVGALPVWLAGAKTDWSHLEGGFAERAEWTVGVDFMVANGKQTFFYFTLARLACIPFSVLGALSCYWWAKDVYGQTAGRFALALWCVSPTIMAYGALFTPDAGATGLGVFACLCFRRWLVQPSRGSTLVAGVALGLVELAKMTWLVLFVLWPIAWTLWLLLGLRVRPATRPTTQAGQLTGILLGGLCVLNAGYLFEGSGTDLGRYQFVSHVLGGVAPDNPNLRANGNRFSGTIWARIPVPLPTAYLTGLDLQKRGIEQQSRSYLRGEWKEGGWWYYYLYALAVKEPVGVWGIVALAIWVRVRGRLLVGRDEMVLLLFTLGLLTFVSAQTGFNRHVRYVMPALPFLFIWASGVMACAGPRAGRARAAALGCLAYAALSVAAALPFCMSYFNELVGGPRNGRHHLNSSNTDWGQDAFELKRWYDAHPDARPLYLNWESRVPLPLLEIDTKQVPYPLEPGWYAVSVNHLDDYPEFSNRSPVDWIGYSIAVYHIE
jgi:4-amino-4-deoxy-L-arabinose transferase-like glycosyltransferase